MEGAVLTFPLEQDIAANRSVSSPQPVFASGNSADDPAPSILMCRYGVLFTSTVQASVFQNCQLLSRPQFRNGNCSVVRPRKLRESSIRI